MPTYTNVGTITDSTGVGSFSTTVTTSGSSGGGTWDPARAGSFSLSNGNKDCLSTLSAWDTCYSANGNNNSSGKYVFRITIAGTAVPSQIVVSNSSAVSSYVFWDASGASGSPGVGNVTFLPYTMGDVLDFAIDWSNGKYWLQKNGGGWMNDVMGNQNPANNTGGNAIGFIDGLTQYILINANTSGQGYSLNTAPGNVSGFSPWA
jgi:hypothetical protein